MEQAALKRQTFAYAQVITSDNFVNKKPQISQGKKYSQRSTNKHSLTFILNLNNKTIFTWKFRYVY